MDEIHRIAQKHGLVVIEDAAHALGAEYKGQKIGSLPSDMVTFSFHPVKPITTGEGGMVATNDARLYERLKLFRSHGITREESLMEKSEGGWYYEQLELGFNYRMADIQAALGSSQMGKLDAFIQRRAYLADRYTKAFAQSPGLICPRQLPHVRSGWHLYVLQFLGQERSSVFSHLREEGIGVNVHYIPVYRHPYYRKHGYQGVFCPNAERLYKNMISLPLYPGLTEGQQDTVIEKVLNIDTFSG